MVLKGIGFLQDRNNINWDELWSETLGLLKTDSKFFYWKLLRKFIDT